MLSAVATRMTGELPKSWLALIASFTTYMITCPAVCLIGSGDLFSGQWDADLPGGLAAARRPALCLNAVEGPVLRSITSSIDELDNEANWAEAMQASLRLKMLVQFVSSGVPCIPSGALSNPGMVSNSDSKTALYDVTIQVNFCSLRSSFIFHSSG